MGVSHDTFYCYRELADEGGADVLIDRSRRAPNFKNRTDEAIELMSRCLEEFATVTLRKRLSAWFLSIRALFIRW